MNLNIPDHSRAAIAGAIEMLIDKLDLLDLDADLEPDTDGEPWLGWREFEAGLGSLGVDRGDDREQDADAELTLGWPNRVSESSFGGQDTIRFQTTARASDDCEEVNEDGGDILDERHDGDGDEEDDDGDREPTLGAPEQAPCGWNALVRAPSGFCTISVSASQEHWAAGSRADGEAEDEGAVL